MARDGPPLEPMDLAAELPGPVGHVDLFVGDAHVVPAPMPDVSSG